MFANIAIVVFIITIPLLVGIIIALIINALRKRSNKITAIALFIDLFLMFGCALVVMGQDDSEQTAKTKAVTQVEVAEKDVEEKDDNDEEKFFTQTDEELDKLDEIDTGITDVLVEKGYSIDHATAIQEILNTIGIESIVIENMTGNPEKGLNSVVSFPNGYTDRDRRFYFTTEDGILFYAGFTDEDLYDADKGGYLKNYNDVHVPEKKVTWDEFYELQELAEPVVKSKLNYPDTAKFDGFSYRVGRNDENYQLLGNVTAKNGLGVKDDLSFSVWFVKENKKFVVEGVTIEGVRVQ